MKIIEEGKYSSMRSFDCSYCGTKWKSNEFTVFKTHAGPSGQSEHVQDDCPRCTSTMEVLADK